MAAQGPQGAQGGATAVTLGQVLRWARPVLGPDRGFLTLAIVYGVGISLLSFATPISVQLLINSVARTALPAPLVALSLMLLLLLLGSAVLSGLRIHLLEVFNRRLFARLVAEVTLRAIHARNPFFADERKGDLFNRFFEVAAIQKAIPSLLVGMFTILLQSAIGFVITCLYHPFFLGFDVVFAFLVWAVWRIWSRGAMARAIGVSHAKYDAAHWLQSIAASDGFYKSARTIDYAVARSETLTAEYVAAHRSYLRYSFAQIVAFLALYALGSAALLALGGWLVITGELSIGQLVAAELILSSVFYGVGQLGPYLDTFYEFVASVEELALLYAIPQEKPGREPAPGQDGQGALALSGVLASGCRFDFTIAEGSKLIAAAPPLARRHFVMLLERLETPERGFVTIGGAEIGALDMYRLRDDVFVLDRVTVTETTILDYLELAAPDVSPAAILNALRAVGLDQRVAQLPRGLETELSATGWPLTMTETIRLRAASALLAKPRVLILSPLYDMIPRVLMEKMLDAFRPTAATVLYFTNRDEPPALDGYFWLGTDGQWQGTDRAVFDGYRFGTIAAREGEHAGAR